MESDEIIPLLDEEEIQHLVKEVGEGKTLQEIREAVYSLYDIHTWKHRKSMNMEIDNLLLKQKKIRFKKNQRLPAKEFFYILATIIDKNRFLMETGITEKQAKSLADKAIRFAKKNIEKTLLIYPTLNALNKRIEYWWNYANQIY